MLGIVVSPDHQPIAVLVELVGQRLDVRDFDLERHGEHPPGAFATDLVQTQAPSARSRQQLPSTSAFLPRRHCRAGSSCWSSRKVRRGPRTSRRSTISGSFSGSTAARGNPQRVFHTEWQSVHCYRRTDRAASQKVPRGTHDTRQHGRKSYLREPDPSRHASLRMNTRCAYCLWHLAVDDDVIACSSCGTPYHADCFTENGGCSTFGCPAWTVHQYAAAGAIPTANPLSITPGAALPPLEAHPPPAPPPAPVPPPAPRPAPPPDPVVGMAESAVGVPQMPTGASRFPARFCDQCGSPVEPIDRYCGRCSNRLD